MDLIFRNDKYLGISRTSYSRKLNNDEISDRK